MKTKLKSFLAWLVHCSGGFLLVRAIHQRLFGPGIRVLFYHRVEDSPAKPDALGRFPLNAEEFDRHLRHLRRFWRVIGLGDAVAALASHRPMPSNAVVITFDDGYRDNYTVALPRLEKYKLPATVFVVSGAVDGHPLWLDEVNRWFGKTTVASLRFRKIDAELSLATLAGRQQAAAQVRSVLKTLGGRELAEALAELRSQLGISGADQPTADPPILSWNELRRLAGSPLITIGAHTVTHPILTQLEGEEVRSEITESCRRIAEELQRPVKVFAYPDGAYNSTTQTVVREAGLVACAATGEGFNPSGSDLTALRRLGAEGVTLSQLALHLAGWDDLREALHRFFAEQSRRLKRWAYSLLELAGFFPLLRYLNRERLTVLVYHGVTTRKSPAQLDTLHVPAKSFRHQMRWLRRKFTPVSLEQVRAALEGGPALPPRPVLVTFDDAYRNNLEVAKPILEELGIPMTLFVPTEFIGQSQCYWLEELEWRVASSPALAVPWGRELFWLRTPAERRWAFRKISKGLVQLAPGERQRAWEEIQHQLPCQESVVPQEVGVSLAGATGVPPVKGHGQDGRATANDTWNPQEPRLTWEELRTLSQAGAEIGSHGASHALLPGLPAAEVRREVGGSKRELEARLGIRVQAFAYPNGSWNAEVRQLVEQEGYTCAFTGQPGTNGRDMDRYLLNRIPINATDNFSEFVSAVSGFSRLGARPVPKILQIGNYPPPQCGWAMQTKLLTEELRRRGAACEVLNINESRKIKSPEYVDVQNGPDYLFKVVKFTLQGYRPHTHVNAESKKGYLLTMAANLTGRALGLPAVMTFHGGLPQSYFPRTDSKFLRWAYRLLFLSAGSITCDSIEIERAIKSYGLNGTPIASIPCFSSQNLTFNQQPLSAPIEEFLAQRDPVFFCFVCFRPEYGLETVLAGMRKFARQHPRAGFIWLGFPAKEVPPAEAFVDAQPGGRPENLLLLGNLDHDTFMTLLSRCFAYFRPHVRNGVSASVLESLAIGVPVVAADNGMRPPGVITYRFEDADDLCAKLEYVVENYGAVKRGLHPQGIEDNIERVAKWLLAEGSRNLKSTTAHFGERRRPQPALSPDGAGRCTHSIPDKA